MRRYYARQALDMVAIGGGAIAAGLTALTIVVSKLWKLWLALACLVYIFRSFGGL
jgi:hypothetical protein